MLRFSNKFMLRILYQAFCFNAVIKYINNCLSKKNRVVPKATINKKQGVRRNIEELSLKF